MLNLEGRGDEDPKSNPIQIENKLINIPDEQESKDILSNEGGCQAKGKELLLEGRFEEAIKQFDVSLRSVEYCLSKGVYDDEKLADKKKEIESIKVTVLMNKAMAHLKLEEWHKCIECSESALVLEPNRLKALHRITRCRIELGEFDKAQEGITKAKDLIHELRLTNPDGEITGEKAIASLEVSLVRGKVDYKNKSEKVDSNIRGIFVSEPPTTPELTSGLLYLQKVWRNIQALCHSYFNESMNDQWFLILAVLIAGLMIYFRF